MIALLKELGIDGQTIVFFTSDNGPQGGPWQPLCDFFQGAGGLRGTKGTLYEGGIRVPLLARWPGRIRPGATSDHVGAFYDMMPTLAELAGARPPKNDGISLVQALLGTGRQERHEYLFWTGAVRMGNWKAVRQRDRSWALYDLARDAGESKDLAAEQPELVRKIEGIFAAAYTKPRQQVGQMRVGIQDFVRGDRVNVKNAR